MRHEIRYAHPGFFTSLTLKGKYNAEKLENQNTDFDFIFVSPFLRTIQTILPYCRKNNKKMKIEKSLYEHCDKLFFDSSTYYYTWEDNKKHFEGIILEDYIDTTYTSYLNKPKFPETTSDIKTRVWNFNNYLNHRYKNKKILLVTHMYIVNTFKKLYDDTYDITLHYPCGQISLLE